MRPQSPFQPDDLQDLDTLLLDKAVSVTTMAQIAAGQDWPAVIGLRHDVDNVIEPAVDFARWEADRGYKSTYYILHSAPYFGDKRLLRDSLEQIAGYGHEIGLHNNAISIAIQTGVDPRQILAEALSELRSYGFDIRSTVAHGDRLCYDASGRVQFVNDELFDSCARPQLGAPDRTVAGITLNPVPLSLFGLEFDANWLARSAYISDSGGRWNDPGFEAIASGFPYEGQLHGLIHPCWWSSAFVPEELTV